MPLKSFLQDLAEAAEPARFSYITSVKAGECDGSISFAFASPETSLFFDLQAIVSDSCDYPRDHGFLVFSLSENCPKAVTSVLEEEAGRFTGATINDLLVKIENIITSHTFYQDPEYTNLGQPSTPDFNDDESSENDSERHWESDDEDQMFLRIQGETELKVRIRRDFRAVKKAGLKVGYLGLVHDTIIVSVSCRIAKLGISEEAMNAWSVRPSEYLVLLIRYQPTYLHLQAILETVGDLKNDLVQMHVGLCDSYKPSPEYAIEALQGSRKWQKTSGQRKCGHLLKPLFIGKSLNLLLRERLLGIIKLRLRYGFTWTGAELFFQNSQGKISSASEIHLGEYLQTDNWATSDPAILAADHMAESDHDASQMSFPLLAMQFTLRHFVKCTEFCLVCHCKTGNTFEALKPYVCSSGLCLYQYMELNMGPNLEYEIYSQPLVIELLVSFAYARASSGLLGDFPTGLRLRVPKRFFTQTGLECKAYQSALLFIGKRVLQVHQPTSVKVGDWITIIGADRDDWHCRVEQTINKTSSFVVSLPIMQGQQLQLDDLSNQSKDVTFDVYDTNLDDLTLQQKQQVISNLLGVLPSIEEIKTFIGSSETDKPPSSWTNRISPAGLDLLRWIVASNRSFITQDENDPRHQVTGMNDYIQFRLVQGAADKEQRFINAVNSISVPENPKHPTLFAWHGSPVPNWHSILREGLHFKQISNGRACGNGVYLSNHFHTSIGYTTRHRSVIWPQSRLNLMTVISLNEVVNAPEQFVCCAPHYVVQHLDWIQPRYLFVKRPSGKSLNVHTFVGKQDEPVSSGSQSSSYQHGKILFYQQDERHLAMGPGGLPINIPISILSGQRGKSLRTASELEPQDLASTSNSCTKKRKDSLGDAEQLGIDDNASVETTTEDLNVLLSDDESPSSPLQEAVTKTDPKTDFQPRTLSLPTLAPPQYATTSATKVLQQQLNATIKIQERMPLNELGWYVDPNLITTVYQWIVELHSFDPELPLAKDLKDANLKSIILELRFPSQFPMDPPFVRVIRPRLLGFNAGGGGHVTAGGAMCMELLTHSGWLPTTSIESVLLQVRMAMMNTDPRPARLNKHSANTDYSVGEAVEAYKRAAMAHGWVISKDIQQLAW